MKILVKISMLVLGGLFLFFASCQEDILKEEPPGAPNVDDFYKTDKQLDLALNGVYQFSWDGGLFKDARYLQQQDETTDIIKKNAVDGFSYRDNWTWDRTTKAFSELWNLAYGTINSCNYIIAALSEENRNKEDVNISDAKAQQIGAETRFWRAFLYKKLVDRFGGVPLHKEPTKGLKGLNKPRKSEDECYTFIEEELNKAIDLFGDELDVGNYEGGRVTLAAAQGLLARVHAQQNNWEKARDYADAAISHDKVKLQPDYSLIWHPDHEAHGEHILASNHVKGGSTSNLPNHQAYICPVYGYSHPDFGAIDFALNEDQKAHMFWVDKDFYESTPETYRKKHTMRNWMPYYIKGGEYQDDSVFFDNFGPCTVKRHILDESKTRRYVSVDEKLMRASEMYLIKAEAENELNGPTQVACDAINMVRARARGDHLDGEQTPHSVLPDINPEDVNKDQFRDSVITEFARELILEGKFRSILRRHDMYTSGKWTDDHTQGNREDYREYFPIPYEELDRNPNLTQNEGYAGRKEPEGDYEE